MKFKYEGNSLKAGTYRIVNSTNGKFYIGSTYQFKRRWNQHANNLVKNKHGNPHLQNSFNYCGTDSIVFEIIEIIAGSKQERLNSEQLLLDKHWDGGTNCYNIEKNAWWGAGRTVTNSTETRRKISNTLKGHMVTEETRKKIREARAKQIMPLGRKSSNGMLGKCHSESTKEKLRMLSTGRTASTETKRKMSESQKDNPWRGQHHSKETISKLRKIYDGFTLIAPNGEIYTMIHGLSEFARRHGLNHGHLSSVLSGERFSHKGWKLG